MLARRIERPQRPRSTATTHRVEVTGRWRDAGRKPSLGPGGPVVWWERPAPRGDESLWQAVQAVQERRQRLGVSVTQLAQRMEALGRPLHRATLSRILNGKQATTWDTVGVLADLLDVTLYDDRLSLSMPA